MTEQDVIGIDPEDDENEADDFTEDEPDEATDVDVDAEDEDEEDEDQ